MARSTKLTKEIQDRIIQAIQTGATYEICAQYAGIGASTLYLWMKQGREQKSKATIEFLENIKRAESRGAIANLGLIQKAAQDGDWKASAWILERRHGYNRNGVMVKPEEESKPTIQISDNTKDILQSQLKQSIKASEDALKQGSYQAFAALQRQTVNIAMQLKIIDAEANGDDFENQSDSEILEQISNIIYALPPVLRQKLEADIISNTNITALKIIEQ
jgi:glutamate synthase domain-containing protein 3